LIRKANCRKKYLIFANNLIESHDMKSLFFIFFFMNIAFAETKILLLSNNSSFGAIFPCSVKSRSLNTQEGIVNALECEVDNESSLCRFLISEQPLDMQVFNKSGFRFIEEVHHQYALQLDKNYKKISEKIVDTVGLGKTLTYELNRTQNNLSINVKGTWIVSSNKLLRGAVSCAPVGTKFMKSESALFLQSLMVVK
jgi:hypothetical protein